MKRFIFAAALVALAASVGTAEEKPATPMTVPAAPVVVTTAAPVAEYVPAQPQRRGLFGRFRNRNSGTTTYTPAAPVMTTPITTPVTVPSTTPTPMPPISTPTPMPMPGSSPTSTIIQASGSLPAGTYTTTDGTIIQIGGTSMESQPTATESGRRGLFGRLRSR